MLDIRSRSSKSATLSRGSPSSKFSNFFWLEERLGRTYKRFFACLLSAVVVCTAECVRQWTKRRSNTFFTSVVYRKESGLTSQSPGSVARQSPEQNACAAMQAAMIFRQNYSCSIFKRSCCLWTCTPYRRAKEVLTFSFPCGHRDDDVAVALAVSAPILLVAKVHRVAAIA